ncbi:MAG: cysteine desulfurase [Defluviitaleaceae bacterium]|nr:cysteine desulfurase [Defluviitaleaceae bacterium]
MLDTKKIRKDFPILEETMNGKPLIYLDNGATALKPKQVIQALEHYNAKKSANVHRGVYKLGNDATELYEEARQTVADFIGAFRKEIVFTKSATESLNIVAMSYGLQNLKEGDEILTTELEHHSSFLPWQHVAKVTGAVLKLIPLTADGRITIENVRSVLSQKTKVVAVNYVSNVMGYIAPIKEICRVAHEHNAVVSVDAAQAAPHLPIDVKELDCDFLSFTGHKMLGPTGVGVLYGKYDLLQKMPPFMFGGEMIDIVDLHSSTFKNAPYKFEAGTPVIAGAIGLGAAIKYLQQIGLSNIHAHEIEMKNYALKQLQKVEGVTVFNPDGDTGIVSFNVDGVHPHDMATVYDSRGICVRAGHHCTQLLMKWLKQPATLRASVYLYTTKEEIDTLVSTTVSGKDAFINGFF